MRELALFAGAGGGILGGRLVGWRTVGAVEIGSYARSVLVARQNDGCLDPFPVWGCIRTFDARPLRGRVDVVSGGFPCQDISSLGRRAGMYGDTRTGLWREYARVLDECRPEWVFAENVPPLRYTGLGAVLADLAALGYDAAWDTLGGDQVEAPTLRERLWVVAHANGVRLPLEQRILAEPEQAVRSANLVGAPWFREEPIAAASRILGMGDGLAPRVDRLHAIGNGQIPNVAALAWRRLSSRLLEAQEIACPR